MAKKTWTEKLNDVKDLPKVVNLDEKAKQKWGGKTLAIAKPTDIYEIMKNVPGGKLITTSEIREIIAKKYDADIACPLTTGMFVNVSANASLELDHDMPYWRTLKSKGELNLKYPNAPHEQIALLEEEGFKIIQRGKKNIKYFVEDYEKFLVEIR